MNKADTLKIAIVGRPNVGKSSLFNSIVGARKAIVEAKSGTTRDRLHARISWRGRELVLIDTAGFDANAPDDMAKLVLKQIRHGVEEADIILFVTDGLAGIVPQDRELSSVLRKTSKKVFLVVNKIDNESSKIKAMEFYELGLGEPYAVSALFDRGVEKLCDDLIKGMEKGEASAVGNDISKGVKVAIVGRPNVGKSSYLNSILNAERAIVHPVAGTTRDSIDTDFRYKDRDYILIDTAGIRHNTKLKEATDFYGGVRSKEAIERCDVALVLIDGLEGLTKDSVRIIDMCLEKGKALVLAVNKWDLVKEGLEMSKYREMLARNMSAIKDLPVVFMSCKTGRNVRSTLDLIWSVHEKSKITIGHDKLAGILQSLNNASEIASKRIRFKFLKQKGVTPPEFILGIRKTVEVSENLKRYVENFFRKNYDFEGLPIRIRFEKESGPGRGY